MKQIKNSTHLRASRTITVEQVRTTLWIQRVNKDSLLNRVICTGQQKDYSQRCHTRSVVGASHRVHSTTNSHRPRAAIHRLDIYLRAHHARLMGAHLFV
jgi:hypothetical protein